MLKKTIPYEDYNGTKREEDFYFNLTETELAEMQLEVTGGLDTMLQAIIKAQDIPTIAKLFKQIILNLMVRSLQMEGDSSSLTNCQQSSLRLKHTMFCTWNCLRMLKKQLSLSKELFLLNTEK